MAKKRTKAERSAAAKASWDRRRKGLPPMTKQRGKKAKRVVAVADIAMPTPVLDVESVKVIYQSPPQIVYAMKEGNEIYVCFAHDGSLNRNNISDAAARKLLRDLSAILI